MQEPSFLSRGTDHLGFIGKELRDLQGFATLAYELIQNADDAEMASQMSFDVRRDALVVDNDGIFADCLEPQSPTCPWEQEKGHRCDFHSFRAVAGGDKRRRDGTTGAFGVGFIAVYQITDRPELISAGRHWIVVESAPEDRRIDATCSGCSRCDGVDGTRLILPWAMDPQSPLRRALQAQAQSLDTPQRLMEEIVYALPTAMIFLKRLRSIEVRQDGGPVMRLERVVEGNALLISDGATDRIWHIIRGDFEREALRLRAEYGHRIEPKRSSQVAIAIPTEPLEAGRLCAVLPTQDVPGFEFPRERRFLPFL